MFRKFGVLDLLFLRVELGALPHGGKRLLQAHAPAISASLVALERVPQQRRLLFQQSNSLLTRGSFLRCAVLDVCGGLLDAWTAALVLNMTMLLDVVFALVSATLIRLIFFPPLSCWSLLLSCTPTSSLRTFMRQDSPE